MCWRNTDIPAQIVVLVIALFAATTTHAQPSFKRDKREEHDRVKAAGWKKVLVTRAFTEVKTIEDDNYKPDSTWTINEYDTLGRLIREETWSNSRYWREDHPYVWQRVGTRYFYDSLSRLVREDNLEDDTLVWSTTMRFDTLGRISEEIEEWPLSKHSYMKRWIYGSDRSYKVERNMIEDPSQNDELRIVGTLNRDGHPLTELWLGSNGDTMVTNQYDYQSNDKLKYKYDKLFLGGHGSTTTTTYHEDGSLESESSGGHRYTYSHRQTMIDGLLWKVEEKHESSKLLQTTHRGYDRYGNLIESIEFEPSDRKKQKPTRRPAMTIGKRSHMIVRVLESYPSSEH